jgi:predicted FMN-binding regulatory protein PaiB
MRKLVDGFLSLLAAIATVAICGVPSWFTYQAIMTKVAPTWAWAGVIALGGVGFIMTLTFLRKAFSGVSPSRDRPRR